MDNQKEKSIKDIASFIYHDVMTVEQQAIVRFGMMPVEINEWIEKLYKQQYKKSQMNHLGINESEVAEFTERYNLNFEPSRQKVAEFSKSVFVELLKISKCPF